MATISGIAAPMLCVLAVIFGGAELQMMIATLDRMERGWRKLDQLRAESLRCELGLPECRREVADDWSVAGLAPRLDYSGVGSSSVMCTLSRELDEQIPNANSSDGWLTPLIDCHGRQLCDR